MDLTIPILGMSAFSGFPIGKSLCQMGMSIREVGDGVVATAALRLVQVPKKRQTNSELLLEMRGEYGI
jgi:hypothetical protein